MRPKTYGRRARKKSRLIHGYVAWPLERAKALQTFSRSKKTVEDMIFLKTGHKPEALGLQILKAEVALRVFERRFLLAMERKPKVKE